MVTLILTIIAWIIPIAMLSFKEDQKAVLLLAGAFCSILVFVMIEYFTGVVL